MARTFSRASQAYSHAEGNLLASGVPDKSYRLKIDSLSVTKPTGQGEASGNISFQDSYAGKIGVGIDRTSANLFYTLDGDAWTKWASPGDAYQCFVYPSGSDFNAITFEGSKASGLEVHRWEDITGTPSDTRCKMGGSTSTSAQFHDRVGNNLMTNSGITPGTSSANVGASGVAYEDGPVLSTGTDFTISMKFSVPNLGANGVLWHLRPNSGQTDRLEVSLAANGNVILRVGSTASAIVLNGSAYDDGVLRRVDVVGTRSGSAINFTMSIYDSGGTLIESDSSTGNTWDPNAASDFLIGSRTVGGSLHLTNADLSELVVTESGSVIRNYPLNSKTALVDGSLPATSRLQTNGLTHNNGTIIFGVYVVNATSADNSFVYRSTDGIHFPVVLDHAEDTVTPNNHHHCVAFLHNLNNPNGDDVVALCCFGDGDNRGIYASFDDGLTWSEIVDEDAFRQQPIGMWDALDGQSVVVANDDTNMVSMWNFNTMTEFGGSDSVPLVYGGDTGTPRYDPDDASNSEQQYAWACTPIDGLYVTSRNSVADMGRSTIQFSRNFHDWITVHYMATSGEYGIKKFGRVGDYILGQSALTNYPDLGSNEQIRFQMPEIKTVPTVRVSRGATNEYTDFDESTGDDISRVVENTANAAPSLGTGGQTGDSTTRAVLTQAGNISLRAPRVVMTATDYVTATAFVRGKPNELCTFGVYDQDGTASLSESSVIPTDNWVGVTAIPVQMSNTGHRAELLHSNGGITGKYVEYDRIMLLSGSAVDCPHPWVQGGTTQAVESLSDTIEGSSSWSNVVTLYPWTDSLQMIGPAYLFTYSAGDSSVAIWYDASSGEKKFKATYVINGGAASTVETSACWFNRNTQIRVTSTFTGSSSTVVIRLGDTDLTTLTGSTISDFGSGSVTLQTGNTSGALAMPAEYEYYERDEFFRTIRSSRRSNWRSCSRPVT